jgi:hypothetical protein
VIADVRPCKSCNNPHDSQPDGIILKTAAKARFCGMPYPHIMPATLPNLRFLIGWAARSS